MSVSVKVLHSRNSWKIKAMDRGEIVRYQRKELNRTKQERDDYKKQLKEMKAKIVRMENTQSKEIDALKEFKDPKEFRIYISLTLFFVGRISFRAVSRVIGIIGTYLGIQKAPCPQSIINWTTQLSCLRIQNFIPVKKEMQHTSNGKIWMIDTSIALGCGKILAIIELDKNHYNSGEGAPTLQQINCVSLCVSASWTGEKIAELLEQVISQVGKPSAFLKDGGTDLSKAVRLLSEQMGNFSCIDDISHKCANLLKYEYEGHPQYKFFLSCCGKASKNLKQTILACLAPPKVSTKARFMNLHHLVSWAKQILQHSPRGRSSKHSILSKLRKSLNHLPKCRDFIKHFHRDANALLECQKVLKNKGLSQDSYNECKPFLRIIPLSSSLRKGFENWVETHLAISDQLELGSTGMPISSDNIESLFGVAKRHGTGVIKDANRIGLRIPALCGSLTIEEVRGIINMKTKEQQKILDGLSSLTKQRRKILPNPGTLDQLQSDIKESQDLRLIPKPGIRENNVE